ncbi:MAG: hypothetical protein HOK67_05745 [Deltaproteobacteria bacterium]|nr:hypothetical protein [Deltaproteobacteria bacterium]
MFRQSIGINCLYPLSLGISSQLQMPMRFIGIGKQAADDLRLFNADEFMQAIFDE